MTSTSAQNGRNYHHPFQPYKIQKEFMDAVYDCLEQRQIGIFESPTGTGKSLSLLCASLTWLRDFKGKCLDDSFDEVEHDDAEPTWIKDHEKKTKKQTLGLQRAEEKARLARIRIKEEVDNTRANTEPPTKRQRLTTQPVDPTTDAEFLVHDYDSDEDLAPKHPSIIGADLLSTTSQSLLDRLAIPNREYENETELEDEIKIFFCSRTHTQLKQVVDEIKRVRLPPIIDDILQNESELLNRTNAVEEIRHVPLASRKTLCINKNVAKLGNATAINERCIELQQSKTLQASKCIYVPNKERKALSQQFRDLTLSRVRDIEDVAELGNRLGICPYYSTRESMKPAEIVTLPYPLLLQRSAREALGLSIQNHVVIIDEAHNLMDSISSMHSINLTLSQLRDARSQLTTYLDKFKSLLKGRNRVYVTQIVRLIDSIASYLQTSVLNSSDVTVEVNDLMQGKGCDQINLFKITRYMTESKLARKVESYALSLLNRSGESSGSNKDPHSKTKLPQRNSLPALSSVQTFIMALTYPAEEGRFFYSSGTNSDAIPVLKYVLLDPTEHFRDVVREARTVILAGGTMSPLTDYTEHLFSYLPMDRIKTLSCSHIVPESNLLVCPVGKGPSGVPLNFAFDKRDTFDMVLELGKTMERACSIIPDGVVAFFPSYAYLNRVVQIWKSDSNPTSGQFTTWEKLRNIKEIFFELHPRLGPAVTSEETMPMGQSSSSKELFSLYSQHIAESKGGLLLAVVGGSLSEGINFTDALGRGVFMVGLPYPNSESPEWKAKLDFVNKKFRHVKGARTPAQEHYENTCMRAVNQSIGRAIRHKQDYASIILFDERYHQNNIQAKLPRWVRDSIKDSRQFGETCSNLQRFFENVRK